MRGRLRRESCCVKAKESFHISKQLERADVANKGRRRGRGGQWETEGFEAKWMWGKQSQRLIDVCKIRLFHQQEKARSDTWVTLGALPLSLSLPPFSLSPPSPVLFPTPAPFIPLLLIPFPLVLSAPSFPPSLDLPCGCPVTLSRRGG